MEIRGIIILAGLVSVFPGCAAPESEQPASTRAERSDQESWEVRITLTHEGAKRAIIRAGHLEKYHEQQYILLDQNVEVDFYDPEERHTTNLVAHRAEVDEKNNFMIAIQDVVVVSDSGITLYTDTLSWDNEQEQVYTEAPVMLTTEVEDTLYGTGFESDVSLEHWRILQPWGVTGRGADEE